MAVAVLGIAGLYAWSGHFWVDLVDEGYFLDLSQRVLAGELPYRDFTTYYTPGIFYLFAAAFHLFGANLLVIRYVMAALRALCAVLLYALTRRVAPAPLAWAPFLLVAALDHWPIEPEPHPSWPSLLACLLTVECIARHHETGHLRWLGLAGAAAGVSFLFKQNLGAFTALGIAAYVLLRPRADIGAPLRAAQGLFVVTALAAVTAVMWSNLDAPTLGALWLPLVVTLGLLWWRAARTSPSTQGSVLIDAGLSASAFGLVTLSWLAPLVVALGLQQTPFALFAGAVNQEAIAVQFAPLMSLWPFSGEQRGPLTADPLFLPLLSWLDNGFGNLHLYLPALGTWAGIAALLRRREVSGPLPWYVLFGCLSALVLYPREDTLHTVVASPLALVAGTGALALTLRACGPIVRWRRAAVAAAMLVPVAAVAPQFVWRVATVISPDDSRQRLDYASLDLPRAPVLVPRPMADNLGDAVRYMQAGTPTGAPLFAYPAVPLFNFLADRPNPTRFDHFLPGTLSADDFDEVIRDLERARPRYVLWDHGGVVFWHTDPANRPLSDYIWQCYRQTATFGLFLVLERDASACPGAV